MKTLRTLGGWALVVAALLASTPMAAHAQAQGADVSIVGDFRYNAHLPSLFDTNYDHVYIHEVELAVQGYLSPWSRADFFLSKPWDGNLEVEEGFLTLTELPYDLKARVGKWKMPFGKLNPIHPEAWWFIDAPLIFRSLLGGEDGWNDKGVELQSYIANPWDLASTATLDLVNGENPTAFNRGPMGSLRLTTYLPFNDEAGLEVGLDGATQLATSFPDPQAPNRSSLVGADLRYRWRPDPSTSFTLLGEYMQLLRDTEAPSGEYLEADYQWATDHNLDLRLDRSFFAGQPGTGAGLETSITYTRSLFETTRLKVEATHAFAPVADNRVMLQTVFVLGPHKHALNF